jgi:hypothetical protein
MTVRMKRFTIATLSIISALHTFAAGTIVVESRKADGTPNTPAWTEVSGKWGNSKNKTRAADASSLVATNVSACVTNSPVPAIKISPELEAGTTYKVEVTFSTSSSYVASPDLMVAVSTDGVSASTIPTNSPAFQGSGADNWNTLGTITPSANRPVLTFTFLSGTLSRESRWYADAIRFTPEAAAKKAE